MVTIQTPIECYHNDFGAITYDTGVRSPYGAASPTRTVAHVGDWEVRVSDMTGDVYVRRGHELRYVGVSSGSVEKDAEGARRWLASMRMMGGAHGQP